MKKMRACSFCGNMRMKGISILEQWMCSECENKLLEMEVEHPYYQYHIDQIKNIWKSHYLIQRSREIL